MDTNHQYFDCLCRTCMNELEATPQDNNPKPQQQWNYIFDRVEEYGAFKIAKLLSYAVPQIKVKMSDELPKRICCKCLQQLLSVYRFQQMCVQSEQQMRQRIPNKLTDSGIPAAATESEIGTNHLISFQSSSTEQNIEHTLIQEPLLETTEQVVKPEAAETSDVEIDKLLEDCRDSQGNLSEFVKNEPIEDDDPEMEYSDYDTIQSIISVKDEVMTVEAEEQQVIETNVKKPYKCPYCTRKFNTISNMYQHRARHEVACDICGKTIVKQHLKTHKLTHRNEKAHKCHFCGKRFNLIWNLRDHIRTHTGEKPYKCKYCERSFSQNSNRKNHMRLHHGDNIYRCELCPLAFPLAKELRAHLTGHENEDSETRERNMKALKEAEAKVQLKLSETETQQPSKEERKYECPYCRKRFIHRSSRDKHKRIHEGVQQEACDICGKNIAKWSLKQHKRFHSAEKVHECDICEKRSLRVHIRKHTGEKPLKCKYCECSFSDCSSRINHMRLHLGNNIHRCELCPLAFPLAKELRAHLTEHNNDDSETRERNMKALKEAEAKLQLELSKNETQQPPEEQSQQQYEMPVQKDHSTHGEDKPYKCPYCKRKFNTISNMNQHKARHEVACDICGKTIVKCHLKRHKLTHSNEKAHKCDFCGKRSLRLHIRIHTGEKPFKCKYCERSFTQAYNRTTHMRIHYGDNVHRCNLCPLAFPLAKDLRAHLTEHDNDDSETRERNMKALKEAEAKLQLILSETETQQRSKEVSMQQLEIKAKE